MKKTSALIALALTLLAFVGGGAKVSRSSSPTPPAALDTDYGFFDGH